VSEWRSIDTIPNSPVRVMVLTYTGIICPAYVNGVRGDRPFVKRATPQYNKRRVMCFRADKSGDVAAVAWMPLREEVA